MTPQERHERALSLLNPSTVDFLCDLRDRLEEERETAATLSGLHAWMGKIHVLKLSPFGKRALRESIADLHLSRVALRRRQLGLA